MFVENYPAKLGFLESLLFDTKGQRYWDNCSGVLMLSSPDYLVALEG
jgi:hypothetical protein